MNTSEVEKFAKDSIGRLVAQSHFSIIGGFSKYLKSAGLDITTEQSRILFTLYLGDGRKQQDISNFLMQEKSSTSRLVNSLEKKGYLIRKQGEEDERQKLVYLTPKGRSIERTCLTCAQEAQASVREKFDEKEWKQLILLLQKLKTVVRSL